MKHRNNFDLIRLLAAMQVMLAHTSDHLAVRQPPLFQAYARFFPGVVIFFMLSGALIYASLERDPDLGRYALRRARRIYPALWVSLLVTLFAMIGVGFLNKSNLTSPDIPIWLLAHGTIAQFQSGALFATWGAGGTNGALWTISVELQFYVLAAMLFRVFLRVPSLNRTAIILSIGAVSLLINHITGSLPTSAFFRKLTSVTAAPYLFYFCIGMLVHVHFTSFRRVIAGKFAYWLIVYLTYISLTGVLYHTHDASYFPNIWGLAGFGQLAALTFSAAYTAPGLADRVLRGTDLSYGIYIYHMVVFGTMIQLGLIGSWHLALAAWVAVFALALASWFLVEHPILQSPIRQLAIVRQRS